MENSKPVQYLVVDSSAFIRNAPIKDLTDTVYCIDDVVNEIKDANTRASLQVLPYDLKFKEPSADAIKFVSNFSKKTGDYYNLSAVDLKLLALTYQLCKENMKSDEFVLLKTEPVSNVNRVQVENTQLKLEKPVSIAGFYLPKKKNIEEGEELESELIEKLNIKDSEKEEKEENNQENKTDINNNTNENLNNVLDDEDEKEELNENDNEEEDDEEGWITPSNLEQMKKQNLIDLEHQPIKDQTLIVGCITSDFSMQNVLIQIGIPVLSVDGLLIRKARSYVLKCTACHKITTNMAKQFCPNCSYKTLERVLVTIDSEGNKIYKGRRKPPCLKGLRFSLPMPRGGKHSNYPILSEDQPRPQNLPSKKSLIKNNPLDPDYICQSSPFATRDVYSRASRLGIRVNNNNKSLNSRFNR